MSTLILPSGSKTLPPEELQLFVGSLFGEDDD
jgi:hypothetical protein